MALSQILTKDNTKQSMVQKRPEEIHMFNKHNVMTPSDPGLEEKEALELGPSDKDGASPLECL